MIEIAPAILMPHTDSAKLNLSDYDVNGDFTESSLGCVMLGFGSFYNHDEEPNLVWGKLPLLTAQRTLANELGYYFAARRNIDAGEELTISYGLLYWLKHSRTHMSA